MQELRELQIHPSAQEELKEWKDNEDFQAAWIKAMATASAFGGGIVYREGNPGEGSFLFVSGITMGLIRHGEEGNYEWISHS